MKILLTGATGYIGQRLLPVLLNEGHEVYCCVRDKLRFNAGKYVSNSNNLHVVEANFLKPETLNAIPADIDAAYYLIHSMSVSQSDFESLEADSAENFKTAISSTNAKQVIYLSGIVNDEKLSKHLSSRMKVEKILSSGSYALTTLRAGIIVGSGSASFEIIRDLVEKLPVMITPRWLNTRTQPIAIRNVIEYLSGVLGNKQTFNNSYDIGGKDILTYKDMLLKFAKVRNLKRKIFVVPVMTPRLSSYWLYFVTSVPYSLAVNLVNSMKVEVICRENNLQELLGISLIDYETAIRVAFDKIEHHEVASSWTDSLSTNSLDKGVSHYINVPTNGCFTDIRKRRYNNLERSLNKIFSIGGENGWYTGNLLWEMRGFLDKLVGGPGLRRGRKDSENIYAGETLDFWKVLLASREEKRLLLYAEMKLPGEAWLEFKIEVDHVVQTATFRPLGLLGRAYWYGVLPFHGFIFSGMLKKIAE
ncbi:MAG: SDR family oxidoreductase [Ignavibacteria bacterium]